MDNTCIKLKNVSKKYDLYSCSRDRIRELFSVSGRSFHEEHHALKDINFDVYKGETFGIIGTNGAGKSTLLKIITGIASASAGSVSVVGKVSALLELGAGFNRNYTGIENIYLNGIMMGYTREQMAEKLDSIIEFADIGEFIKQPVKTYSSGMFARLAFSVAISVEPDILIVDETLSVGDVFFQNKCYKKFEELKSKGTTVLFVSHDIGTVRRLCSRVLWIEHGTQQMIGDSISVCTAYTNSILEQRGRLYSASEKAAPVSVGYIRDDDLADTAFPPIHYSEDSILDDDVAIISCFMQDATGQMVTECHAGEEYHLCLVFSTKRDIPECIVGFVIETVKGLWVINCNSVMDGLQESFHVNQDMIIKAEFRFIMPPIVNGDYVVGFAVSEGSQIDFHVITWLYNVLYLQITNVGENDGVLRLDPTMKLSGGHLS